MSSGHYGKKLNIFIFPFYFKGRNFCGRKFCNFANFGQNRESLFPRKILKEAIRESLFPQNFYFFTKTTFVLPEDQVWLANKGWEDRIVILNYNLFKIEEEFTTVRESLFPRKISKRAIRESLFSWKISIGAIRESLFPKFRVFFGSQKFLPLKQ